jgi:hypothetical protein
LDKVAAVLELQPPANANGMQRLLGMMEQYGKYIPGYALLAAPLQVIMRRGVSFVWTEEALCSAPVLALPDWKRQFILTTDCSRVAIGAVLSHIQPLGEEQLQLGWPSTAAQSSHPRQPGIVT